MEHKWWCIKKFLSETVLQYENAHNINEVGMAGYLIYSSY